jgi:hypothetical protein
LRDDGVAENCNSGQIATSRGKLNLGLFGWDSSLKMNTKKLENSPIFPFVTYTASSDQRFRCYGILRTGKTAETVPDGTTVWTRQNS